MSSHDKRYDNSATWKSHRSEFSNKDSPERSRKLNSNFIARRYHSYKDRKQYDNRSRNCSPNAKRHSCDYNRLTYAKMLETFDEKEDNEAEKSEVRTSGPRNVIFKSTWSRNSPAVIHKPKRPPLFSEPKPLNTAPLGSEHSAQTNFSLIFQHINSIYTQSDQSHLDRPMSFIDRLIADEAMRMLSAASSNEVTSLNEPYEVAEIVPSDAPVSEATESSKQEEKKVAIAGKINDKAATVSAADSALLQKSAEQVTKKLINQLSTMNKYDLKHMIDNPAGKYETALNRHAQSKLRAEVRKQLKSFGLGKLGSACVADDGTVESDEAIDAEKIPPALLEQIGHALDLDIFDLSQPESTESNEQLTAGVESSPSNSNEPESKEEHERHALTCTPLSTEHGSTERDAEQNDTNASGSARKISTKTKNILTSSPLTPDRTKDKNTLRSSPLTPGHTKKIIIRKANATIRNNDAVRTPVASTLQLKALKPLPKHNSTVVLSKNVREQNIGSDLEKSTLALPLVLPEVQSLRCISQIEQSTSKDSNITLKVASLDKEQATNNTVNSLENVDPIPADANSGMKNMTLLRVSTVEELNRRLDEDDQYHPCVQLPAQEADSTAENNSVNDCSNVQFYDDKFDSNHLFTSFSPQKQTKPVNNTNADNRTLNVLSGRNTIKKVLLKHALVQKREKRARISMDETADIGNVTQTYGTTPKVNEDQSRALVTQALLPVLNSPIHIPVTEGNKPKKRKCSKQNESSLPAAVCSNAPSNDTMASNPKKLRNKAQVSGERVTNNDQINVPSPTKPLSKKNKKRKVRRFEPANNEENANKVAEVPHVSTTERVPSLQSAQETPNEDHILNNAYDQYLNKSHIDRAPETVEQQTHMTIAKVCSISGSQEMSTTGTVVTVDEATNKDGSGIQLPPEISLIEPKTEESITTSHNPEQNVQNGAPSENCTDKNLPDWNLSTASNADRKEGIARVVSLQPATEQLPDEYILGGDSGDKCIPSQTLPDGSANQPEEQTPNVANHSATPLPTDHTAKLQSLCDITERMVQTLEAQTMELHNRKMQIDAQIMQLQTERIDIDQQLQRMYYMRTDQINFIRLNLLELLTANGTNGSTMQAASSVTSDSGSNGIPVTQSVPSGQTQAGVRQQERTIRRITPIGGNSVLMNIFKRRRALSSERSTEENPPVVDHA